MASLESFCDKALQRDYNHWGFVIFHDCEKIYSELAKSSKAPKNASDVESSSSVSDPAFVSEKLPKRRFRPAQRPRNDVEKTQNAASAALLVDRLRSNPKLSGAESS